MATYKAKARVEADGSIRVVGLPVEPGDHVEVVVRTLGARQHTSNRYPLRGDSAGYHYHLPFSGVDVEEWESPE